jgi:hypothetical protein
MSKHQQDEHSGWARFEAELAKRTAAIAQSHRDELHALVTRTSELEGAQKIAEQQKAHEIEHANRRVEDSLREIATLRERNHELESQMSKVARVGKKEELDFAEDARTWAGICVSEKLPRNGDFILAYLLPSEVNKSPFDGGANLSKSVMPMLIGCIEYHYATSEKPHKTWFVYVLSHKDDPALEPSSRAFFSIGKTIPNTDMVLLKSSQFAD